MTPVDDELRRTLAARADALTPSPDPLAGITTRARGIRRRRAAFTVLGSALAVAVVAVAVPAVVQRESEAPTRFAGSPSATPTPTATPEVPTVPANVLDWAARPADPAGPSEDDVARAFADARDNPPGRAANYRALFTSGLQTGYSFTVGQAWFDGDALALTVSYATGGSGGPKLKEYGETTPAPVAVVALLDDLPGTSSHLLVVVPVPGTGQVSYSAKASGAFTPAPENNFDGVALLGRAAGATDDRLEILDGDGDLDRPTYRGPVSTLLLGGPVG